MNSPWKKEYADMAGRYSREVERTVRLADAFEAWLVEAGHSSVDAGTIVSKLYAEATDAVAAR